MNKYTASATLALTEKYTDKIAQEEEVYYV